MLQKIKEWLTLVSKWPVWGKYSVLEWIIAGVGVFTILLVFLNLFTQAANQTSPPHIKNKVSLDDPVDFEKTLTSTINSSIETASSPTILTNGQEFLPDLLSEIEKAKSSIYITDYIWENGDFGNTLFQALINKAKEGVSVRILLDGQGGHKATKTYIKELTDAGGKVSWFRPLKWWNITRLNRRTHVRDFVIDGTVGYLGGIAISDLWLGNATSSKSWHDFMFKVNGAMATRLNSVFQNLWSETTGEILNSTSSNTTSIKTGSSSQFIPLFSTPSPDLSSKMDNFLWLSIEGANKSIHIENPYLLPSKTLLIALTQKAESGVDVELIVPGKNIDTPYTRWASQSFYKTLLKSGVKIYEYQPSRIHSKIMVIDDKWSVIGSANLDNRSAEFNLELITGVMDENFAKNLDAKFNQDKTLSSEITLKDWDRTSFLMYPIRFLSRLFIHQY